jgi:hypothetical protein
MHQLPESESLRGFDIKRPGNKYGGNLVPRVCLFAGYVVLLHNPRTGILWNEIGTLDWYGGEW